MMGLIKLNILARMLSLISPIMTTSLSLAQQRPSLEDAFLALLSK
jgi:hypothetical protein